MKNRKFGNRGFSEDNRRDFWPNRDYGNKSVSGGSRDSENCNLYVNKSTSHKNFYYLGAKCWNNLPKSIRILPDISTFSNSYKKLLLSSVALDPNYMTNNLFDYFYAAVTVQHC